MFPSVFFSESEINIHYNSLINIIFHLVFHGWSHTSHVSFFGWTTTKRKQTNVCARVVKPREYQIRLRYVDNKTQHGFCPQLLLLHEKMSQVERHFYRSTSRVDSINVKFKFSFCFFFVSLILGYSAREYLLPMNYRNTPWINILWSDFQRWAQTRAWDSLRRRQERCLVEHRFFVPNYSRNSNFNWRCSPLH